MRTNIVLDDSLIEEGFALTGVRTKKELVHLALQELIRIRKKKNLLDLAGKITLTEDYDHKASRKLRHGFD
jgi:Arc/MetJ family transcription regulator